MEIIVTHLTRMAHGYICVAGLDEMGRHVRPVTGQGRIPASYLASRGGPFDIGTIVDLGEVELWGVAPEVEDQRVVLERVIAVGKVSAPDLWAILAGEVGLQLADLFGQDMTRHRNGAVVPLGGGRGSLGTLAPGYRPKLYVKDDRVRCALTDPDLGRLDLSVTDLGLYRDTGSEWVADPQAAADRADAISRGTPVLLNLGLGRPWPKSDPAHWLQVNNIFLFAGAPQPASNGTGYSVEEIREKHPNAYRPWSPNEETRLLALRNSGASIAEIARAIGRQPGGIRSRLRKLGRTDR